MVFERSLHPFSGEEKGVASRNGERRKKKKKPSVEFLTAMGDALSEGERVRLLPEGFRNKRAESMTRKRGGACPFLRHGREEGREKLSSWEIKVMVKNHLGKKEKTNGNCGLQGGKGHILHN